MIFKVLFLWVYKRVRNYNLFIPEENDYVDDDDDDDNNQSNDPATVLKHQKYTTWLYILLRMVCLYVLFYIVLVTPQPQTIVISHITPEIFDRLYLEHAETLSCPCSTVTMSYKVFISNTISFHPVCSSYFISQEWIEALYHPDASRYGSPDFRTTAASQFILLASLCSISQETVVTSQIDFDNNEFVTVNLLTNVQLQSEVNGTHELFKNSLSIRIISFLNYLRITTRANYLVSALNTNLLVTIQDMTETYVASLKQVYHFPTHDRLLSVPKFQCGTTNPTSEASFFTISSEDSLVMHYEWYKPKPNSARVNGFYAGCTPLEALLESTLDCLYDIDCLESLPDYFPNLDRMNLTWTDFVLLSKQQNVSVYNHLLNLFVDQWSITANYSKYFNKCVPSFCTYTTTKYTNISYAITILLSLYGGLIIILRLIAPFLINVSLKLKCRPRNTNVHSIPFTTRVQKFVQWIQRLNLFKLAHKRTENDIKQQKMITRIYVVLLFGSFLVLLLFTSLNTQTAKITVPHPSLTNYTDLKALYSNTLTCPCSTMVTPYHTFISLSPIFHRVCSSDFVTEHWISILKESTTEKISIDWRNRAFSQFQLLSDLCQLANRTVNDAVRRFRMQSFITSSVPSEDDFNIQLNATLDQFFQSTLVHFGLLVDTVRLFIQVDQPLMGTIDSDRDKFDASSIGKETNNQQTPQLKILLSGTRDINSTLVNCICATNPNCQSSVAIYDTDHIWSDYSFVFNIVYIVPGSIAGCSSFDSLLLSTLQCFHLDSDCFLVLMNYIKKTYINNVEYPSWFDVRPLVYDSKSSRFPPNTSISAIARDIMIERWNSSFSYDRFYGVCAPSYCTYYKKIRTKTIVEVIVTLISMIGSLSISLRIITSQIVRLVYRIIAMIHKRKQRQQQQKRLRRTRCNRLKAIIRKLIMHLYTGCASLNIFFLRDFGSNVHPVTARRLGRWATRLYIVLLIVGLATLVVYTAVQPQALTKTFDKPPLNLYNDLIQNYGDKLTCSCSLIASPYNLYVNIEPIFHEICSSPFASDEWRVKLTSGLVSNFSVYPQRDYRRFLSAHLQFLTELCKLSIQSVNNSIGQFLNSLFVSAQLLSEKNFHEHLNWSIEQSKANAPKEFVRLLFLIRNINHGNAITSTYGTNFDYIILLYEPRDYYAPTEAVIYDDECSCGLYSNCTSQANFITRNSSVIIPIQGLKIGCTPSESFRASTLECFYDSSCMNLIQEYTTYINFSIPLSSEMKRFTVNTTVAELINDLFVEKWETTINYSSYFEQCSPLFCSYTYIQQFNTLYTVTLILGLGGGLILVLRWICPRIFRIVLEVYRYRKKKINIVHPKRFLKKISVATVSADVHNISFDLESIPTNVSAQTNISSPIRCSFKIVLTCILLLLVLTTLIIFSIFVGQQGNNQSVLTTSSTSTTAIMNTDTTTRTTTPISATTINCQFKFQRRAIYEHTYRFYPIRSIIGDFNGDNQLDFAFFNEKIHHITVFLGNGNGSFTSEMISSTGTSALYALIAVGDFNHDHQLDISFVAEFGTEVTVLLGNGTGMFTALTMITIENAYRREGITTADFNRDGHLDLAISNTNNNNIDVLLGNGDGTLSKYTTLYTGRNSQPKSINVADFNNDSYPDIAVGNYASRNIGVFLGYGNGTFQTQKTFFTGGGPSLVEIAIGDFNSDSRPDVVFSYDTKNMIGVLFAYENGTLGALTKVFAGNKTSYTRFAVGDFNGDGHLDIVAGHSILYGIDILLGHGNGNFSVQDTSSIAKTGYFTDVIAGDFNGDGYQDMIITAVGGNAAHILLNTCECCATKNFGTNISIYQ